MKKIFYFFERFQRRNLLIAAAILLLIIYAGQWVNYTYAARQIDIESRLSRLGQYQLATRKAEVYKARLQQLVKLKKQVGKYFFTGEDDNRLSSAMQLKIQALVAKAGLQAESIRPVMQKSEGRDKEEGGYTLGEVLIKTRLAGTLSQFSAFMAELYRSEEYFGIESISIRPYRNTGLKIFVELRGYYVLLKGDENPGEKET